MVIVVRVQYAIVELEPFIRVDIPRDAGYILRDLESWHRAHSDAKKRNRRPFIGHLLCEEGDDPVEAKRSADFLLPSDGNDSDTAFLGCSDNNSEFRDILDHVEAITSSVDLLVHIGALPKRCFAERLEFGVKWIWCQTNITLGEM
jgi:hypothetical protein